MPTSTSFPSTPNCTDQNFVLSISAVGDARSDNTILFHTVALTVSDGS